MRGIEILVSKKIPLAISTFTSYLQLCVDIYVNY